jgi:nitrogen fixation NifU-like protein
VSELRDLYQELILDHQRRPRNYRRIEGATHMKAGVNPLCGDSLVLFLDVADGVVRDISFEGSGCAISKASASMLTERLKGRSVAEAESVFSRFHHMLTEGEPSEADEDLLGKLAVFRGVREFPARVKCATLAWQTLRSALEGSQAPVSTE